MPVAAIYGRSPIETLPKELSDSGVLALEGAPGRGAFFASMQYREAPKTAFARRRRSGRPRLRHGRTG
ncbi:hypothetical protein ACFWD7_38710 [Streptomyces mirabilis]|uniref:hypothetical protein n=1 Tax=Streptomyces mirabilis TaxID=68239 RepID=UPI0036A3D715